MPLVVTKQEADRQTVTRVWKGGNKSEFESVLSALQQAQIPLLFREHLNVRSAVPSTFLGLARRRRQATYDSEFEVKVLGSDADRAQRAVLRAVRETENV
jgi:hypothetical protein